ncbi:cupin domain-containing protein [Uruburuella testudinis]|uniref:Cupin domain-containing protein n=1 Tax=Uruburuella testudinis TaxID=1282863 RepID=A0ABY4DWM2_9NEIS|nr:cupin domain-containing protein [Uruburuella testudinis]UOO81081.1 cupin domain-containing protein [Uruburuella testudinis]
MNSHPFAQMFALGEKNDAYAQYFTGQSYLANLADGDAPAHNVTFEPGCRNHWHIHHGQRQLLICTAGRGWYQEAGKPAQAMVPGVVIDIPADVKHWHGAAKDSWFSHIAIMVPQAGAHTEWCAAVTEEEYAAVEHA